VEGLIERGRVRERCYLPEVANDASIETAPAEGSDSRYTIRLAWERWRETSPDLSTFETGDVSLSDRDEHAVSWMRETAAGYLADREAVMTSLQARGGQLAGFAGVVLGLLAPLAARTAELSDGAGIASRAALLIAGLAVTTCAVVCLFAVMRPTRVRGITASRETLNWFTGRGLAEAKAWQLEGRTLRFYPAALAWQEWINSRKAAALFLASVIFAIGLASTAVALAMVIVNG